MEVKGSSCGLTESIKHLECAKSKPLPCRTFPIQQGWRFRQADQSNNEWLAVSRFPTNVHLDLIYNGLIPDPFIAKNEKDVQWVGETSWVYKTTFQSPDYLESEKAVLAFDGLDTHAIVSLNGKEILRTENMFIPETVDVTRDLRKLTDNDLEIRFESTYLIGKKLVEKNADHQYGCWNGDPSRLAVRKAQYHYGWDWGPTLLTCGPWRPIDLQVYTSRIEDLYFTTIVDKSLKSAEVAAKCEVEGYATSVRFEIIFDGETVSAESVEVVNDHAAAILRTQKPKLWYPAKYGEQPLYQLRAILYAGQDECDTACKRLGLRRVEVIQRKLIDEPGTSFFFQINDIPVFCGGSNWIPADSFIPKIDPSRYQRWIKLAVDSNQTMLRMWGGGIFEEQTFYDSCDELGLLVWHDFLFACGNYPAQEHFLDLVKREATANVKLLRHHPSIVIWAGNNEDYQYRESESLTYDPEDHIPCNWLKTSFPARYIYEKILISVIRELTPDTHYRFGSPFGGKDTRDPTIGDIHQWNVWHGTQEKYQDFDSLIGRFVSEFGMEAFPSVKTVDSYLLKGKEDPERYPQSSTIDFHNKAAGHSRRLAIYMEENLQYQHQPLDYYIYCTQLMQAECLATAFRLWKRQWRGPGREYCGGALLWQLNDCWPTQSWSIVDYHLRPKLAYYAVKRELADFSISTKRVVEEVREGIHGIHSVELWATNLSLQQRTLDVVIKAWDIVTGKRRESNCPVEQRLFLPNRSTEIRRFKLSPEPSESEEVMLRTVFAVYLIDPVSGKQVARSINWPEPLKHVRLQEPKNLNIHLLSHCGRTIIELSAENPVKGVSLEVLDSNGDDVIFDDNCVDLVPDETVQIGVHGLQVGEVERITVRYLKGSGLG